MKKIFGIVVLALTGAAMSALSVQAASAVSPAPPTTAQLVVQSVGMRLDCSRLSGSAMQYAVSHQYCTTSRASLLQPNTTVGGNCGDSFLYMWNSGGDGGHAKLYVGGQGSPS